MEAAYQELVHPTGDPDCIAYARVSTNEPDPQAQIDALTATECSRLFLAQVSARRARRPGLAAALHQLGTGGTLVVWKLDRLGRSVTEVVGLVERLHGADIALRILTGPLAGRHSTSGSGTYFFTVMAALAELERDHISERTIAGLAVARNAGRTAGRPAKIDADKLAAAQARRARGETLTQIAKDMEVSVSTVCRRLKAADRTRESVTSVPPQHV